MDDTVRAPAVWGQVGVEEATQIHRMPCGVLFVINSLRTAAIHAGELIPVEIFEAVIPVVVVLTRCQHTQRHTIVEIKTYTSFAISAQVRF